MLVFAGMLEGPVMTMWLAQILCKWLAKITISSNDVSKI